MVCDEFLSRIQRGNDIDHFFLENTATVNKVSNGKGFHWIVCVSMQVLAPEPHTPTACQLKRPQHQSGCLRVGEESITLRPTLG